MEGLLLLEGLADLVEDDVRQAGVGADAGGVPDELAIALGGVAPGSLAILEALADDAFGFAKQDRNILPSLMKKGTTTRFFVGARS